MDSQQAIIWFLITVVGFVSLMVLGIYEGIHSYDAKSKVRRHRLRHH